MFKSVGLKSMQMLQFVSKMTRTPTMLELTLQFLAITLFLEVTPGPGVLFVLYQSAFSFRNALAGILGLLTSNIIWISLVATGLGLVLTQTPVIFNGLRYIGAAYLVYLGYKIIRYGIGKPHADENTQVGNYKSNGSSYRRGMFTSLSNPKALLFFMALFPQFTRPEFFIHDIFYFGAIKMLCLAVVMTSYALMGRRVFNYLGESPWTNTISRVLGGGIIVAAIAVARG
jgi:homoserine/homoserine lactone efflux protein|tara:strand:- start:9349 stop:10035 length:687 start_codon:yes stop_codon:yes gene_type:complete